jgi:hypothetical protein
MKKYLLIAGVWAGLSYPIYHFIGPVVVCIYGFGSLIFFFIWIATRERCKQKAPPAAKANW